MGFRIIITLVQIRETSFKEICKHFWIYLYLHLPFCTYWSAWLHSLWGPPLNHGSFVLWSVQYQPKRFSQILWNKVCSHHYYSYSNSAHYIINSNNQFSFALVFIYMEEKAIVCIRYSIFLFQKSYWEKQQRLSYIRLHFNNQYSCHKNPSFKLFL